MLSDQLKNHQIILASASPRRQQFFKDLGLDVSIQLKPVVEEYPPRLRHFEISDYLAQLKSLPFKESLTPKDILITSDTIVWLDESCLGKPKDEAEAFEMIKFLSNRTHKVITSVCFTTVNQQKTLHSITKVTFRALEDDEIWHYIHTYKPYDKAGAYGIQEWIGLVGVTNIEGSYFNVMGLPTDLVYTTLKNMV